MLTLGSLFDGIGGWLLAAQHAGIEPIWASEIAPFPASVTAHHFPNVVQLGDIAGIQDLPPVDIVTCGSPCQDLSVAGKRKGLSGERSGLFIRAVELVRRLRMSTGGRYPRFFVWENVPGAFSSNHGMDFRAVLEEIGETEIPMPENGRWAEAGLVELPECEIAWRTLDAQYWLPQRRKRIFLVGDFGAGKRCAGEILFERESVRGDSSESGETRERTAAGTESGIGKSIGFNIKASAADSNPVLEEATPPLRVFNAIGVFHSAGFMPNNSGNAYSISYEREKAPCLSCMDGGNKPTVAIYDMTHADEVMRKVPGGRIPTLNARMGTGGNQVPVVHTYTQQAFRHYEENGKASTLKQRDYKNATDLVCCKTVRRLTPTECERLQGLPDGYTLVGNASDTQRYKALGNGMAQPCADYVIKRIVEVSTDD